MSEKLILQVQLCELLDDPEFLTVLLLGDLGQDLVQNRPLKLSISAMLHIHLSLQPLLRRFKIIDKSIQHRFRALELFCQIQSDLVHEERYLVIFALLHDQVPLRLPILEDGVFQGIRIQVLVHEDEALVDADQLVVVVMVIEVVAIAECLLFIELQCLLRLLLVVLVDQAQFMVDAR